MTGKFANLYWSSDYKTGIDKIRDQTYRSIDQIHELRTLVFNYMNYFHSNSQQLNKLSIETYLPSSSLRPYNEHSYESSLERRLKKNQLGSPFKFRSVSQADRQLAEVKHVEKKEPLGKENISVSVLFEKYVEEMVADSQNLLILASVIDREVLEKISHFTKIHEPKLRSMINNFEDLFQNYDNKYREMEKLKEDYEEYKKMIELSQNKDDEAMVDDSRKSSDLASPFLKEDYLKVSKLSLESSDDSLNESPFDFPLQLGPLKLKNEEQLSSFMSDLIKSIPTKKKRIIIPGYRNEIFSSELFCNYFKGSRRFGIDPTRSNLEKLGQSLLDSKLAVGTGFIGSKKFKGEGIWLEWTELAIYISKFEDKNTNEESVSDEDDEDTSFNSDDINMNSMNQMALNASKKFNGMFKNVRTSLLKKNYHELLKETEEKYNECYFECQDTRHFLDLELQSKLEVLEEFEKRKIELIYQSLTKLLEILYNFSLNSSSRLHSFVTEFINEFNVKTNYVNDFNKLIENFSTGIYSPSVISPDNLHKKRFSTNQSNNNYQNLRYQFNLYRDIPLQSLIGDSVDNPNKLLSMFSIPQFLFKTLTLVEMKLDSKEEKLNGYWLAPIDHHSHWIIKEKLIELISAFEAERDSNLEIELPAQAQILQRITDFMNTRDTLELVNFIRNWLLQISESLIPCIAFEPLMKIYNGIDKDIYEESPERHNELVRILSSIPRSNLSALVFLLEHISIAFGIAQIPNYNISDQLSEDLIQYDDPATLKVLSIKMNSMDIIGGIPFIHIILKPYPVKSATGFKPPLDSYNKLLFDLLNVKLRAQLFKCLVEAEKKFKDKKNKETEHLPLKKPIQHNSGTNTNLALPKSPRPLSTGSDSFVLRQFRTGHTPIPSPSASPSHSKMSSIDELHVPKVRNSGTPTNEVRLRSSSLTFLTPEINVEFEKK